jgi:hypothetical protein
MPGCYEGALRLKTTDSTPRRGPLILPCVHGGVVFATDPLSLICFESKVDLQIRSLNEELLHIGMVRCAMSFERWVLSASVDASGLRNSRRVCLL